MQTSGAPSAQRRPSVIYLDMDGVLMDFDAAAVKFGRVFAGPAYVHKHKSLWTPHEVEDDTKMRAIMALDAFWPAIPPMADAHELWGWARPHLPHILTATPNNAAYRDRCARDKLRSIFTHFDPVFPDHRFHAVLRSEKRRFAVPGAVLVDDNEGNCREWRDAGGTAILHTSAAESIRQLKELTHE